MTKSKSNDTNTKVIDAVVDAVVDAGVVTNVVSVKGKRGRKSKKELMASLNIVDPLQTIVAPTDNVILSVTELTDFNDEYSSQSCFIEQSSSNIVIISNPNLENPMDVKHVMKKRGRKPKGGKIIQQVIPTENLTNDKPNVILHLKCSMKDLHNSANSNNVDSYTFGTKNELCYDIIGSENINSVNTYYNDKNNVNSLKNSNSSFNDYEDEDLHVNNVNNKKSACFWDSCDFDNPPVYIPKHFINGTYHVYGCFCSPECGVAYLMNENIDSSTKFERYHLFNHIYSKIYDYKKNIKPSPNPHYMLEKFYGNLSIQEYRSLLRNERLFIIVDKPLTRILPELHDDNDEFILNNKIIPSNNNYQLKSRMQKKKSNKNSILNEKFGMQKMICNDDFAYEAE